MSHFAAMLLYNIIVAALLVYARTMLGSAGIVLWPAVAAHLFLAGWCVAELTREARRVTEKDMRPGR